MSLLFRDTFVVNQMFEDLLGYLLGSEFLTELYLLSPNDKKKHRFDYRIDEDSYSSLYGTGVRGLAYFASVQDIKNKAYENKKEHLDVSFLVDASFFEGQDNRLYPKNSSFIIVSNNYNITTLKTGRFSIYDMELDLTGMESVWIGIFYIPSVSCVSGYDTVEERLTHILETTGESLRLLTLENGFYQEAELFNIEWDKLPEECSLNWMIDLKYLIPNDKYKNNMEEPIILLHILKSMCVRENNSIFLIPDNNYKLEDRIYVPLKNKLQPVNTFEYLLAILKLSDVCVLSKYGTLLWSFDDIQVYNNYVKLIDSLGVTGRNWQYKYYTQKDKMFEIAANELLERLEII